MHVHHCSYHEIRTIIKIVQGFKLETICRIIQINFYLAHFYSENFAINFYIIFFDANLIALHLITRIVFIYTFKFLIKLTTRNYFPVQRICNELIILFEVKIRKKMFSSDLWKLKTFLWIFAHSPIINFSMWFFHLNFSLIFLRFTRKNQKISCSLPFLLSYTPRF